METKQLYIADEKICPRTNYENDGAAEKIKQMQELLDEITNRVIKQLLQEAKGYADDTYMQATGYTDAEIAALINGAPSTLDTLKEIADAMIENENVVQALEAAIGARANEIEFQAHAGNKIVHITADEREKIGEIDTIKQSFQNGCSTIADKLTSLGVSTAVNASPDTIAENIQQIYDSRTATGGLKSVYGFNTPIRTTYFSCLFPSDGIKNLKVKCTGTYCSSTGGEGQLRIVGANNLTSNPDPNGIEKRILAVFVAGDTKTVDVSKFPYWGVAGGLDGSAHFEITWD